MESGLDMWRAEVWHPMVVHFPIALLLFGTLAWLASAVVDSDGRWSFLRPAGRLAMAAGVVGAWAAVFTGDIADAEVVRTLCDPTVVEDHENLAWATAITFSTALGVELTTLFLGSRDRLVTALRWLVAAGFIAGSAMLGYVGHLGARLVYQQGAAVHQPSETCAEFE